MQTKLLGNHFEPSLIDIENYKHYNVRMIEGAPNNGGQASLGDARVKLDQMTERITSRLKDRSRFPQNSAVYEPDGVHIDGRMGISLLQFAIEGLETYQASLGRFEYADQFPVLNAQPSHSSVERTVPTSPLQRFDFSLADSLLPFYKSTMEKYCGQGNNPDTYGETAYLDADLIQMMNERINIGRYVAHVKGINDPSVYDVNGDRELLMPKLKDIPREEALIGKVRSTAERYELNPDMAEEVFRWMIERTIDVEVAYIKSLSPENTGGSDEVQRKISSKTGWV